MHARQTWWARFFALLYDPVLWLGERAGMTQRRCALLRRAHGRVLEIGAGTGLNVPHYPPGVELILAEPDPSMRRRLVPRAEGRATVIAAPAEDLPLADGSVDIVVSTFVLCTVDDPVAALAEVRRVLRPGGELLLIEHIRSGVHWRALVQRAVRRPWARVARGCRCDQPTLELLRAAGFRVELDASLAGLPPIIGPIVVAHADTIDRS